MEYISRTNVITNVEDDKILDIVLDNFNALWENLNNSYRSFDPDNNQLAGMGFDSKEKFEDRNFVFNHLYNFSLVRALGSLYDASLIENMDTIFDQLIPKFLEPIVKIDVVTRSELSKWYAKLYMTDKSDLIQDILHNFIPSKITEYKQDDDGNFHINFESDKSAYLEYFIHDFEIRLNQVMTNYEDFVNDQAEKETENMKALYSDMIECEKRILLNFNIKYDDLKDRSKKIKRLPKKKKESYDNMCYNKLQNYGQDQKYSQTVRKFPTISAWIFMNRDFNENIFKDKLKYLLWNLSMDNFDMEKIYLLEVNKGKPNYDIVKQNIFRLINTQRNQAAETRKQLEERRKKLEQIYKEANENQVDSKESLSNLLSESMKQK